MPSFDAPDGDQLSELLERQDGMISAGQLAAAGVARSFAHERVLAGRWQRPHRGVYAAFSGPLSRTATIWAALLRCGLTAVASHQTAAELDGLSELEDERVHVTVEVTHRVYGRPSGIRVHYAHRLPRTRHPTKFPPRTRLDETVLDLVDSARSAREAAGWIVAAIQRRLTEPSRVAAALALRKKIRWRAMATWTIEYATRVELDGRVGHQEDGAFRDRRRDNDGVVGGQATLRYGHPEVFGSPCDVAAEQAVVLRDRGWQGEPRPCGSECHIASAMRAIRIERDAA